MRENTRSPQAFLKSTRATEKQTKKGKKKSFNAPLIKRSCTCYTLTFSCFIKKKKNDCSLGKKSYFTKHIQLALRQFLDLSFPSFFRIALSVYFPLLFIISASAFVIRWQKKSAHTQKEKNIDGCAREELCTNILRTTLFRYTSIEQDNRKEKKERNSFFFSLYIWVPLAVDAAHC